ncbi:MAG TPA: NAD-dependent epimerase/dehydratase family protein [Acidobacteriaceae bacterium]|nr:NAD-dependent epimerase/dehydratase family protein [Acidobacteriaceae bacterium]
MSASNVETGNSEGSVVLVGGAGFIGTRLAALLRNASVPFRIADIRESSTFSDLWTPCDVRNLDSVRCAIRGANTIINLAAEHRDDVRPLSRYREVNVDAAQHICTAARECGIEKIIFTSSVAVYGFQPEPVDENGPFAPFNEYGKTKLAAEQLYCAWAAENPLRSLVIIRPTVVFGEGNRGNVYNLLHQIASGKFLMVGPGTNVKSMAYVGNVAAFLAHTLSLGPGMRTINYVDNPDMSTRELVEHVRRCVGNPGQLRRVPKSLAMMAGHVFDMAARISGRRFPISAIRVRKFCETTQFRAEHIEETGFTRPYSLADGLARTIDFEFPHSEKSEK